MKTINKKAAKSRSVVSWSLCFLILVTSSMMMISQMQEKKKQEQEKVEEELQVMPQIELKNPLMPGRMHEVRVNSSIPWNDSGFDVFEGQQVQFMADRSQRISLQQGNPVAVCGPDGKDLKTVQKPIKDRNLGALIGRVVKLVSIEIDEETEERVRNELIRYFFVGSENIVTIPMDGRLYLGVNENVILDNSGFFFVTFYLR